MFVSIQYVCVCVGDYFHMIRVPQLRRGFGRSFLFEIILDSFRFNFVFKRIFRLILRIQSMRRIIRKKQNDGRQILRKR